MARQAMFDDVPVRTLALTKKGLRLRLVALGFRFDEGSERLP